MSRGRFLIVAWPAEHDEDLQSHAVDIQDAVDCDMGCPRVLGPIPPALERAIEQAMAAQLELM